MTCGKYPFMINHDIRDGIIHTKIRENMFRDFVLGDRIVCSLAIVVEKRVTELPAPTRIIVLFPSTQIPMPLAIVSQTR